jgi:hypothetical protein
MTRTAIAVKYLPYTSTRPSRLKAYTLSDHPVSATVSFQSHDCDADRYAAVLAALLAKLGDGWGDASQWVSGGTQDGRVYVRLDEGGR